MNSNLNYNPITLDLLYRSYIEYIRNSNRILNNSISIVYNQQQTYNEIIRNYNYNLNNITRSHILNTRPYFSNRQFQPSPLSGFNTFNNIETNRPSIFLPTLNDVINNITFIPFCNIDISTNNTCPITQRDFDLNDNVIMLNRCKHIYDPQSILQWFTRCSLCPLCRTSIISGNNREMNQDNTNDDIGRSYTINDGDDDEDIGTSENNNEANENLSFAQQLANIISNEINRDIDFSGNIQIELGLSGQ